MVNKLAVHIETEELGASLFALIALVFTSGLFAFMDFITGVMVARSKSEKIQSGKISNTVGKYFGLILWFVLALVLILILSDNYFVLTLLFGPLILNILKEFISIGENLEARNGKKPYMFTIIDRVFSIIEKRFFKHIESKVANVEIDDLTDKTKLN